MALDFWQNKKVVALAGGVGGAKLAHGLAQVLPTQNLTVIVNIGDDFKHYGLHISPDLDTVMYTLGEVANEVNGWGLEGETWQNREMLTRYGEQIWFNLGDRDLATHLIRTQGLHSGKTLTAMTQQLANGLGIAAQIIPPTNDPLATVVHTKEIGTLAFQEYFVRHRWQPTVTRLEYMGEDTAQISAETATALATADCIIICPSNPMLSIEPILRVRGVTDTLKKRTVPCVVVSPLIGGKAVKGPTDKLMRELNLEASQLGIARYYEGLADGLVIDSGDTDESLSVQQAYPQLKINLSPTLMTTIEQRREVATNVLAWTRKVLL